MIHLHTAEGPARAETWLAGVRFWAEATEPAETMDHVLADLARRILAAGGHHAAPVAVCRPGRVTHAAGSLGALAGGSRGSEGGVP
jgi:hypothetical protein